MNIRQAFLPGAAAVLVAAALVLVTQVAPGETPVAIAGPCAAPPDLYRSENGMRTGTPIDDDSVTVSFGGDATENYWVQTYPDIPPTPKPNSIPFSTIEIIDIGGDPGISFTLSPEQAQRSFASQMMVEVANAVDPGTYEYQIRITCHPNNLSGNEAFIPLNVEVPDACPEGSQAQPASETCPTPTPTPTPIPTASPIPSPSPTPVTRPLDVFWGDVDCTPPASSAKDALDILTMTALATPIPSPSPTPAAGNCPPIGEPVLVPPPVSGNRPWGDVDCSGSVDPNDALTILAEEANRPRPVPNCPNVGVAIKVGSYYILPD